MRKKLNKLNDNCIGCGKLLATRHQVKYCSQKCQATTRHKRYVQEWKDGLRKGMVGIQTKIPSSSMRRYLFEKYQDKCSQCGWGERNSTSGRIPLEIDHIDGNSENNTEENLRLLCPNCHSLTPYFRNLNKGKGRKWRMENMRAETAQSPHISF